MFKSGESPRRNHNGIPEARGTSDPAATGAALCATITRRGNVPPVAPVAPVVFGDQREHVFSYDMFHAISYSRIIDVIFIE